jgi:hypothetical protein
MELKALRRVVEQPRPLIAGKIEVQPLKRSNATNGDRDAARHARHDSRVEKDSAAGHLSDID